MIVEECTKVTGRIAEYKRLRASVEQLRRFQRVRDVLSTQATRLAPLVAVRKALRDASVGEAHLARAAEQALALLADAFTNFETRPESLIEERTFSPTAANETLSALATELEMRLSEVWQKYAAKKVPPANREVLDVLSVAFPRTVGRIRQLTAQLDQARVSLPQSGAEITEFHNKVGELQLAWQELGGGSTPPAVLTFLKAAASPTGARIDLLSEEVRIWLADHNILQSFSIRVGH